MCTYAQQGYAFGHISLCICVYAYACMWPTNWDLENLLLVLSTARSLSLTHCQKGAYYSRQLIQEKKFRRVLLTAGERKLY